MFGIKSASRQISANTRQAGMDIEESIDTGAVQVSSAINKQTKSIDKQTEVMEEGGREIALAILDSSCSNKVIEDLYELISQAKKIEHSSWMSSNYREKRNTYTVNIQDVQIILSIFSYLNVPGYTLTMEIEDEKIDLTLRTPYQNKCILNAIKRKKGALDIREKITQPK